jgi:hypothetical protein
MNTTTATFDASKLSARDRKNYETGLAIISRKLARARLAEIALKAVPKSFRIVPSSSKKFEAGQPVKRSGRMTTHVVFSTLGE